MARNKDKNLAIRLRQTGKSYSQIKNLIGVSKSTLSLWLRKYPLSNERLKLLRDWSEIRIEKYIATRTKSREARKKSIYASQKKLIIPLSKRDLLIAGFFLYWGEGSKTPEKTVAVTNTDPSMLRFFIHWIQKIFNVAKKNMRVSIHIYSDMNAKKEIEFWSKNLDISKSQFIKPYIKKSKSFEITRKGGFGHGTCSVRVHNSELARKVLGSIQVIRDVFGP